MNIKQVKERYTLETLLSQLGFTPEPRKSRGHDLWYKSPFRPGEKDPSFHISTKFDIWKDFGETEEGGDIIRFAQVFLKSQGKTSDVSNALQWFDRLSGANTPIKSFNKTSDHPGLKEAPYKILSDKTIYSPALLQYLDKRQIPHELAKQYLRQVYFLHRGSGKRIFGLGFKTRAGGYDIRNPYGFKTMIGSKDISFIPGEQRGWRIEIIEGAFDYLSKLVLENRSTPLFDTIITNSINLYKQAAGFVKQEGYSEVILWLDNDKAGKQFENAFLGEFEQNQPITISLMNHIHPQHKDLNKWLTDEKLKFTEKKHLMDSSPKVLKSFIEDKDLGTYPKI